MRTNISRCPFRPVGPNYQSPWPRPARLPRLAVPSSFPACTGADMAFETLASDFYGFEATLTDREKEFLASLRASVETEIKPIVNEYWERAEFPHQIVEVLHGAGAIGLGFPETAPFENS